MNTATHENIRYPEPGKPASRKYPFRTAKQIRPKLRDYGYHAQSLAMKFHGSDRTPDLQFIYQENQYVLKSASQFSAAHIHSRPLEDARIGHKAGDSGQSHDYTGTSNSLKASLSEVFRSVLSLRRPMIRAHGMPYSPAG